MAPLLNVTTILSVLLLLLLLILHTQITLSTDIEDDEEYVVDTALPNYFRSRSRFLHQAKVIKKGQRCNPSGYNICNGVYANNGTSLLYCCKNHCRNILGDENNCGQCGKKCKFGALCCNRKCISVAYNTDHCGKCNNKCAPGVPCNFGSCGYA